MKYMHKMLKIKEIYLVLLPLLITLISCVEQAPPSITRSSEKTKDEISREGACKGVSLASGFLEKQNLVSFFQCTNWNIKFPEMYKALQNIDQKKWDHLFLPLDEVLYAPRKKRDHFFSQFHKLDRLGGLNDLGNVVNSVLNADGKYDENIISIISSTLTAASENSQLSKEDIEKLLLLLVSEKETVRSLMGLVNDLNESFFPLEDKFHKTILETLNGQDSAQFKMQRKLIVDEVSKMFIEKTPTENEKIILPRLVSTKSPGTENPWLYQWLNTDLSIDNFKNIFSFPYKQYPTLSPDLRSLQKYFPIGVSCKLNGKDGEVKLNLQKQFSLFSGKLGGLGQEDFIDYSLETTAQLLQSQNACEIGTTLLNPGNGIGSVNLLNLIRKTTAFLMDSKSFELGHVSSAIVNYKGSESDFNAPLYLIEILALPIMDNINSFNKILEENRDNPITSFIYPFLISIPSRSYFDLSKVISIFFKKDNYDSASVLGKIWRNLSNNQKDFLLSIADNLIKENVNISRQIQFLLALSNELPEDLEKLSTRLVLDSESRGETFESLLEITHNFDSPEIKKELTQFFSRDHLIALIQILSSSSNESENESNLLNLEISELNNGYDFNGVSLVLPKPGSGERLTKLSKCLISLSELGSLQNAVFALPEICQGMDSRNFAFNLVVWLNSFQNKFLDFTNGEVVLLDSKGLLSNESLHDGLTNLKVLDEEILSSLSSSGDEVSVRGVDYLISLLKEHLFDLKIKQKDSSIQSGVLKTIEDSLSAFITFFNQLSESDKKSFDSILLELANLPEKEIKDYLVNLSFILNGYSNFQFKNEKFEQKTTCQQEFNVIAGVTDPILYGHGVNPCPSNREIKNGIRSVILRAKQIYLNNDEKTQSPPFIENLLALVHPDGGILVPFESTNTHRYYLTLKDLLMFSWDMVKYKEPLEFFHKDGSFISEMDRASQLEVVIRDISFKNNYYGIIFQNETSRADDYADATRHSDLTWHNLTYLYKRTEMLATKLAPRMRKNGTLPLETEWKLKNVLNTFRGLHYVADTYEHKGTYQGVPYDFGQTSYKDLMQSFLTLQVSTSSEKSRNYYGMSTSLDSPNDELGLTHNSLVMVEAMNLSAIRNISRFLKDRISNEEKPFFDFINSYNFKRVDEKLLKKVDLANLQIKLRNLVEKFVSTSNTDLLKLSDSIVDWLYESSYNQIRHLENLLGNLSVIGTYIGEDTEFSEYKDKFHALNFNYIVDNLDVLLQSFSEIKKNWPSNVVLHDLILQAEKQTQLLVVVLSPNENDLDKEIIANQCFESDLICKSKVIKNRRAKYYVFLNQTFVILNNTLLKAVEKKQKSRLSVILETINSRANYWVNEITQRVDSVYRYLFRLHQKTVNDEGQYKERFALLSQNLYALIKNEHFSMRSIQNYLKLVETEFIGTGPGQRNPHFRELIKLSNFLIQREKNSNKTNLRLGAEKILLDNYDSLKQFVDDTLSLLEFNHNHAPPFLPSTGH